MMKNNTKGQSAVEYILIVTAVLVVLLIALQPQGFFTQSIEGSLDTAIGSIETMANNVNLENP